MWSEIEKNLAIFETGVLSATDRDGYPYSVRCRPLRDRVAGVLRLDLAGGGAIEPGPASLLFHSHNEELWNLKVFLLRGTVEAAGSGPVFRPERPVTGTGLRAAASMLVGARKAATAYLKKRGLERTPDSVGRDRGGQGTAAPVSLAKGRRDEANGRRPGGGGYYGGLPGCGGPRCHGLPWAP